MFKLFRKPAQPAAPVQSERAKLWAANRAHLRALAPDAFNPVVGPRYLATRPRLLALTAWAQDGN